MSNIHLDGGETSLIKALGFSGVPMSGTALQTRLSSMSEKTLFETLQTLISVGYVSSSRDLDVPEEVPRTSFFVNPGYARELKEAIDPSEAPTRSRRVRRE
ncbi:MAG TPA: hypothetical protein VNQ90_14160 [Chthoniobacteraceae bacterium]|nr:hypothetical protein [Chthoniobacteraceae bacterium]